MDRALNPEGKPKDTPYDPEEEVPLLAIEDYIQRILSSIEPLPPRSVALAEALGCVLAEDALAPRDLPPFTSSAMDGYAVVASDIAEATEGRPVGLRITGEVMMGVGSALVVSEGTCVAVSTGSVVPAGADAVIPVELTSREGDRVLAMRAVAPGKHVRAAGEDVVRGDTVVAAGRRIAPPDLGALAASGFADVAVIPRVRLGVVSTGDELVAPGDELRDGQIYDSNTSTLVGVIREAGAEPRVAGPVVDDPEVLIATLDRIEPHVDAFVCSGGVSMGEHDPVKRAFELGGDVSFVNVAMQPGRPQAFGLWRGKPLFGLPGNPISLYVSFEVFVRPALMKMMGRRDRRLIVKARLDGELDAPLTRVRVARVGVRRESDDYVATPEGGHQSNLLVTFARADGLVSIPAGARIGAGERCDVMLIRDVE